MLTTFSTQLFLQKDSVLDIWQDPKYASANILLEKIYFLSNSEDQRGIIHLVQGQNLTKTDNSYDLICIRMCRYQAVRNVSFPENFGYVQINNQQTRY